MEKEKRLVEINEKWQEAYGTLTPLYNKMKDSHYMYSNKQWTEKDASNSRKKNIPALVYNLIKKNVDVLVGIQRQNKAALKVLPEENSDNIIASVMSRLLHFVFRKGNGYLSASQVFKDQVIGGLGWFGIFMDYSKDAVNGEIRITSESPFDIFFDPNMKEIDLSDCSYLFKRKVVSKNTAKVMFPDFEQQIEDSKSDYKSDYFVMEESGLKGKCVIKEMWERVIEPYYTIYANGEILNIPVDKYNNNLDIEIIKNSPDYVEKRSIRQKIRLSITVNDSILVYDGDSPFQIDMFPYIPAWGFYNKSLDTWSLKLMGLVEPLKDPQREYNKAKANMAYLMLTSIHSGWFAEKNAVDDLRVLQKGMSSPIIEVNAGKSVPVRIDPPRISDAFAQHQQDSLANIMQIGLNAESLGFNSGAESAKAIKMKNMQGMASVGELPDNFNSAFIAAGKLVLSFVCQFYGLAKIMRIVGPEYQFLTEEMLLKVQDLAYDIEIDDTTYSPIQKMYRLETKLQAMQYKIGGIEIDDIIDDLELDAADRVKIDQRKQQAQAQQAQAQQMQLAQAQAQQGNADAETKAKVDNMNVQTQLMGTKVLENMQKMGAQPGDIAAAAEQPQQIPAEQMPIDELAIARQQI